MTLSMFFWALFIGGILAAIFGVIGAAWDRREYRRELGLPPLPRRVPPQRKSEESDADGA